MFRIGNSIEGSEISWGARQFLLSALVLGAFVLVAMLLAQRAEAQQANVDLATDERVVEMIGESANSFTGAAVAGGCDVNGDGKDEEIVGASGADNNGRSSSGSVYVVFGRASGGGDVQLGNLGAGGFRIDGAAEFDSLGFAVKCAGDVNGDGRDDVIAGAGGADNNSRSNSGSAYVVFGKTDTTNVDLANLGNGGFRIDGAVAGDRAGQGVSGAGDINLDGFADLIVGANLADNNTRTNSGSAYVVFGKSSTTAVDLASLGNGGFRMDGAAANDQVGLTVGDAGDVNNDGRPDVIVSGQFTDIKGTNSGSAYVVFGKTDSSTIDLAGFGTQGNDDGYRINGAAPDDNAGFSVAGAGDINRDGRPDVFVGAYSADPNGRLGAGAAYVVYGKADSGTIELSTFGASNQNGFRLDGEASGDRAGRSVGTAGDFNGDGQLDVLLGADMANSELGAAYVYLPEPKTTPPPPDKDKKGKKGKKGKKNGNGKNNGKNNGKGNGR